MPGSNYRNKLRFNKLESEMNSMSRSRSYNDTASSMAGERHVPAANLNDNDAMDGVVLPRLSEGQHGKRMRSEFTQESPRITCSLDILVAIVNEQVRYEMEHACHANHHTNDTNDNDYDEVYENEEKHEEEEDGEDHAESDYEDSDIEEGPMGHAAFPTQTSSESFEEHHTSPEQDAAMGLLMASFVQHYQAPRKRRRVDTEAFEGGSLRSRRLSQNQLYRKRLLDKGVYPVRKGPRQYACSLCCEVFVKEMFVWRHGAKHLESKPFQCALCGGTFNRSDSLQRHVRNFHRKK